MRYNAYDADALFNFLYFVFSDVKPNSIFLRHKSSCSRYAHVGTALKSTEAGWADGQIVQEWVRRRRGGGSGASCRGQRRVRTRMDRIVDKKPFLGVRLLYLNGIALE